MPVGLGVGGYFFMDIRKENDVGIVNVEKSPSFKTARATLNPAPANRLDGERDRLIEAIESEYDEVLFQVRDRLVAYLGEGRPWTIPREDETGVEDCFAPLHPREGLTNHDMIREVINQVVSRAIQLYGWTMFQAVHRLFLCTEGMPFDIRSLLRWSALFRVALGSTALKFALNSSVTVLPWRDGLFRPDLGPTEYTHLHVFVLHMRAGRPIARKYTTRVEGDHIYIGGSRYFLRGYDMTLTPGLSPAGRAAYRDSIWEDLPDVGLIRMDFMDAGSMEAMELMGMAALAEASWVDIHDEMASLGVDPLDAYQLDEALLRAEDPGDKKARRVATLAEAAGLIEDLDCYTETRDQVVTPVLDWVPRGLGIDISDSCVDLFEARVHPDGSTAGYRFKPLVVRKLPETPGLLEGEFKASDGESTIVFDLSSLGSSSGLSPVSVQPHRKDKKREKSWGRKP